MRLLGIAFIFASFGVWLPTLRTLELDRHAPPTTGLIVDRIG